MKQPRLILVVACALLTLHSKLHFCQAAVGAIITPTIFNLFLNPACSNGFYNRQAFLAAATSFPLFGTSGPFASQKRELAAFFAHVSHETGGGCFKDEEGNNDRYHGRGPIQLTGRANYQAAGDYLKVDLVDNPDRVAKDPTLAFKTAIWFWMIAQAPGGTCHSVLNSQGFGATTRIINGIECNSGNRPEQADRVDLFQTFCGKLGVSYSGQLYC
ncbi:hypothetical protein GOP47_0003642 [Adiantum capillus-veneris]|uniref:Glycoside hydrolase family 19 catalytic domain-containing protein n=1 Tax=Adiantum capillus-veneris TaxID=13818 RepID=A0A9D4V630_ADICA|nr:hypothetical protein GOP47_0003642 [Adiantum capillus-veneris]